MQQGFVKNFDILEENYRVDDLLNFSETIDSLNNLLSNINRHSIVGIIGDHGTGKSTMLYQIEKENKNDWVVFDAWAFPNRKDLWEGFVLEFARSISPERFNSARNKIDGSQFKDMRSLVRVIAEGVNLAIPGAGVIKNLTSLLKSSPARRVFDFREILLELIQEHGADLFIVLEDIDRVGDEGIIFLETIRQFITNELSGYIEHRVIFVVPIGIESYEGKHKSSYIKTLDYNFIFEPKINFMRFIGEVFLDPNEKHKAQNQWNNHLDNLCRFFIGTGKTIRDLKYILRRANHVYISQTSIPNFYPDPRITILIEMHDFLGDTYSMQSLERDSRNIQSLETGGKDFYGIFAAALMQDVSFESARNSYSRIEAPRIVFRKNHALQIPAQWQDIFSQQIKNWVQLSDLYLRKSTTEM